MSRQTPVRPSRARAVAKRQPPVTTRKTPVFLWLALEILSLALLGLFATILVLGHASIWFGGSDLTESLLPFAGSVLILAISASLMLSGWLRLRRILLRMSPAAASLLAMVLLVGAAIHAAGSGFEEDLYRLRGLVGGASQAGRDRITHQVFAAYRKADHQELIRILLRVQPYLPDIRQAAFIYRVDPEVLIGIGVAESSFIPRDSRDGGRGLFQITEIPKEVTLEVSSRLQKKTLDPRAPRDNTYLAAATFRSYLDAMRGDLFLGLLAYNIGPKNGGLASIMQQYGARDFFTIQPYLKELPRDYPIRVLSSALAYRLFDLGGGELPRYEEGDNAKVIQGIGIPGIHPVLPALGGVSH